MNQGAQTISTHDYTGALRTALVADLGFHGADTRHSSHGWHPFPAKFPPQLPQFFIERPSAPCAPMQGDAADDTGLPPSSVDLIVTSPPYANNAIDYMRAHKFSLVWFGWSVGGLAGIRSRGLGQDAVKSLAKDLLHTRSE